MKKYTIMYGDNTLTCGKSLEISQLKNECFELTKVLFETFDESEAMEKFSTYKCDCNIQKTPTGYEANLDIYEILIDDGEMDNNEFEIEKTEIKQAPFILDRYMCYD